MKAKGRFVDKWPDLRHTPNANIVATAVKNYLTDRKPVEATIAECSDINQFILTQTVTGDWTTSWRDTPLGKVLRFYKSTLDAAAPIIRTPGGGAKGKMGIVPNSESCIPLEDLPDSLPADIDYNWYIKEAKLLVGLISQPKTPGMNRWAEVMHQNGLRPCFFNPHAPRLSRAAVVYGEDDFTSLPVGWEIGTGTGDGLIAKVFDGLTYVYHSTKTYPSKTRRKVREDHGFELFYGARVPVRGIYGVYPERDHDEHYTPAELKKVGR